MKNKVERLVLTGVDLEVRVTNEGGAEKRQIVGYAAVFDSWSEDLGGFRERIAPGAFAKTLQEADVRGLLNHDPNYVLGRTKSETLALVEDGKGLRAEVTPPDTQWARDLMTSVGRGDINQMSFGFRVIKDQWAKGMEVDGKRLPERTLLEVALYDVSVVTFPAYPATEAGLRAWRPDELYTPEPPALGHSDEPGQADHLDDTKPGAALHSLRRMRINLYERMCVEA